MKSISKCAFTLNAIYKIKIDHTKESCSSVINIVLFIILLTNGSRINAQTMYGTTGLLYAPTAEMQKDKTFMVGGSMIDHNIYRSDYWNSHEEYNPYTYNYYLNITIFPWLEVAYTCTLVKGLIGSSGWPQQTWSKFVNQDRSFHGRLRLWKEGWWKQWTPQIVLGVNDPGSHSDHGGGNITFDDVGENTNHLTRFYLAATKHFIIQQWGTLGIHASVIQFNGLDFDNEHGVAVGVNYRFNRPLDGFWSKALNGLNLMGEYYDGVFNVGGNYAIWKDRINLTASLYDGRYWSVGLFFKVCLK